MRVNHLDLVVSRREVEGLRGGGGGGGRASQRWRRQIPLGIRKCGPYFERRYKDCCVNDVKEDCVFPSRCGDDQQPAADNVYTLYVSKMV